MKKPRIRLSTLSRSYVCSGCGISGSGWTMRAAWYCWVEEIQARGIYLRQE